MTRLQSEHLAGPGNITDDPPSNWSKMPSQTSSDPANRSPLDLTSLIYVGLNSRVVALERETGELIWKWKCPKGSGFAALLLDGDRLIVSVQGYTYCLDPL